MVAPNSVPSRKRLRVAALSRERWGGANPHKVRQSQKLDPEGVYLKRWLPELEQAVACSLPLYRKLNQL